MTTLIEKAEALLGAHRGLEPLVLPNVWDVASLGSWRRQGPGRRDVQRDGRRRARDGGRRFD